MESEQPSQEQGQRTINCVRHGDKREAFVCEHLVSGGQLGFYYDREDLRNPYPDAWCSACERVRLEHGGTWNDESEALIKVKLVCGDCYQEIKARNLLGNEENHPVQ